MFARHNIAIGKLWLSAQDMNMFKSFKIKDDAGAQETLSLQGAICSLELVKKELANFFQWCSC